MTTLVGIALDEGKIKSLDQPITEYLPEFSAKAGFDKITIRHLLLHTSGIKFSDSRINPYSDNSRYYYTRNLRKLVFKAKLEHPPGTLTHYNSINAQLLALVLERATGTTLSAYMEEKVWKRIGMQYNATWSIDNKRKEPLEKAFSNFNCTAIDLAKLGRLYLNNGKWSSSQILSEEFVCEAVSRDTTNGSCLHYQYNFRTDPLQDGYYYARGLFGQLMYIFPKKNMIIIILTKTDLHYNPPFLTRIVLQIAEQV
jgi:CubicO group peptidase (beta-lactamase class C family)